MDQQLLVKIVDGETGEALAGATAEIIRNGKPINIWDTANDEGYISIVSDELVNPDNRLRVSSIGYNTEVLTIAGLNDEIMLTRRDPSMMQAVTVTPKQNILAIVAIAIVLLLVGYSLIKSNS